MSAQLLLRVVLSPAKRGFVCICVPARLCRQKLTTVYIVLLTCVTRLRLTAPFGQQNGIEKRQISKKKS